MTRKMSKTCSPCNLRAIELIDDYICEIESQNRYRSGASLKQASYAKWTAYELIRCIQEKGNTPAINIVEEFIFKMNRYACLNKENSYMFSVAYDTAEDILDRLL